MKKIYILLVIAACFLFNGITLAQQMSGTYYVGQGYSSPNFVTITEAFSNLNSRGVNGAVYLILKNPSSIPYNTTNGETFPLSLDTIIGTSAINTITMKPDAGLTPIISGSSASSIIKFKGTDYFTIDGSNSGGTDRSLTIENINSSSNTATIWFSGTAVGAGATNNTVKNCILKTGSITSTTYAIVLSGSSLSSNGYDNDYNKIQNNHIYKAYYGIYSYSNLAGTSDSLKIIGNVISDSIGTASNLVTFRGIYLDNSPRATVKQNSIKNIVSSEGNWISAMEIKNSSYSTIAENTVYNINSSGASTYGIFITSSHYLAITKNSIQNISTSSLYAPCGIYIYTSSDVTVAENNINNINFSGTGNSQTMGIYMNASSVICNNILVYNNKISNITSNSTRGIVYGVYLNAKSTYIYNNYISELKTPLSADAKAVTGLYVGGTSSNIYYNTIYLNASGDTTFGSSGIYQLNSTITDLRNNIVVNNSIPGTKSGRTVAYRWSATYNTIFYNENSNNNCFYSGTPDTSHLIFFDGTNSDQTITAFKTRVDPRDTASFSELPPFVNVSTSPYDLHLQTTIITKCESGGIIVSSPNIITDFDGNARYPNPGYPNNPYCPATAPDVGADEFAGINVITVITGNSSIVPKVYRLYQNYPNPFNPITNIKFDVSKSGLIKIKIFDLTGKLVDELVNREMKAGSYEVKWNGTNYASGIYFYKFESADYTKVERMVLIK